MVEIIENIPQDSDIFRAAKKKPWIRNGVSYDAFLLRSGETTLSLLLKADCAKSSCEAKLDTCFGEIVIKIGALTNFGLEVKHTPVYEPKYIPYHASVYNLPPNEGESEAEARNIAVELANLASVRLRPNI